MVGIILILPVVVGAWLLHIAAVHARPAHYAQRPERWRNQNTNQQDESHCLGHGIAMNFPMSAPSYQNIKARRGNTW